MRFVADLHLHSKYSRAVSQNMVLPIMAEYAKVKGLDLLSASDWTHPLWLREIKAQLEESSEGIYKLKNNKETLFILGTEIASVYTHKGRLRRIHNLLFAPSFEVVEKINKELQKRGANLNADGRPIIGLSSKQLLELALSIDKKIILIPCHVWTPHFGIYGSASGYDFLEECFEDLTKYIYGIETGLSSDPWMNWQIKDLQSRSILSFSDAHSPMKMGREATVFEIEKTHETLSYNDIGKAIARDGVASTIEFYPEEGKYHYSGHRNCQFVQSPEDSLKNGPICPVCNRRLTEGVMFRLGQLAESEKFKAQSEKLDEYGVRWIEEKERAPFVRLVPLNEIIAESLQSTVASEKVKQLFTSLCKQFGSEIDILLNCSIADIAKFAGDKLAEGIEKVRSGNIVVEPGYDGEYGKVKIWNQKEEEPSFAKASEGKKEQLGLF